jgi:protein arginine kinase activator
MKCERCHKRPAVVFYKAVLHNQVEEKRLCAVCADELGSQTLLDQLLSALGRPQEAPKGLKCASCGLPYSSFQKTWLLGCPDCYRSFSHPLEALIPKLQGHERHRGSAYEPAANLGAIVAKRRAELAESILREDFEGAAKLRDEIRKLEGGSP